MPLGLAKRITTMLSSALGMSRAMKGLLVSTIGTRWKVHMGVHELRADVVHVVRHAAQDGVGDRLGAVATLLFVAIQLLDPLQVDDRHHADQQVGCWAMFARV
jgi:hypothetical protein